MCQVEVWGVLFASVKVGVICTSGQLSSLLTKLQECNCQGNYEVHVFIFICVMCYGEGSS